MSDFEEQASTMVIGPQYTTVNLFVKKRLKAVRVDFFPGGLHRLLGIPMNEIFDEAHSAVDLFCREARLLNEQIANTDQLHERAKLVENFLLEKVKKVQTLLPLDHALMELMKKDGNLPIESAASLACLSLRQFERKCIERLGHTPKGFARIARFSKAYRIKEADPTLTWTAIAHEAGYFDQMHLIRDFKEFAGVRPGIIEKALSETPFRMQADLLK